jgi:hypothetical protein
MRILMLLFFAVAGCQFPQVKETSSLSGVVTSANGPEAGVWVIAETTGLPTRFAKIVVTDERGRYVIPELPKARYDVWVRGYGLVDSPKVQAEPGTTLDLKAVVAPSAAAAAEYYPPIYWYSMLRIPQKSEFPVGGMKSQPEWLNTVKTNGCMSCHALGTKGTRTMPKDFAHMKSTEAWARRIASGQAMTQMINAAARVGPERGLALWADWTDRIAAGELPFAQPQRPQGIERNLVLTLWDWSRPTAYMHDLIGTDRRKPTVNANGRFYGAPENSTDFWPVLDPVGNRTSEVKHPVRDPNTPSHRTDPMAPSPYWGAEPIWDSQTSTHNQMMDERGRVWASARVRSPANPDWCRKGSSHPSAQVAPIDSAARHLSTYDPASGRWTLYRFPGPQFRDVQDDGSAEASYYVWVDWFNALGLGENVPIATGNMSEAYFALVNGKFVTLRVPYPQGFFAKWAEGRIDDPSAGWRGRGLWATYSTRAVFHSEGGTQSRPRVVKFQLRN